MEKLISDNQSNRSYTDDKDLFHVNGHTYALTKMWGDDTLGSIEAIIRLNTSGPEIEFEPTNKGSVEVPYKNYVIRKSGSGTITLEQDGQPIDPVISGLRILAEELNVPLTRSPGSTYNTQTLGKKIIQAINAL